MRRQGKQGLQFKVLVLHYNLLLSKYQISNNKQQCSDLVTIEILTLNFGYSLFTVQFDLSVTLTGFFCLLSIWEGEGSFHDVEEAGIKGLEELGSSEFRWSAEAFVVDHNNDKITVKSKRLINGKDSQLFLKDTIDVKETQRSDPSRRNFGRLNSTERKDKISRGGRSLFPMDRGKCCG